MLNIFLTVKFTMGNPFQKVGLPLRMGFDQEISNSTHGGQRHCPHECARDLLGSSSNMFRENVSGEGNVDSFHVVALQVLQLLYLGESLQNA